jgi:hypothetical protein
MENRSRVIFTFIVLVALIMGLYIFSDWFSKFTGYVLGEDEKTKLAICLTEKQAVLYTSSNCIDCVKHKEAWGDQFRLLNHVECRDIEDCPENLGGVPAWRFGGNYYYGDINLRDLQRISGCG